MQQLEAIAAQGGAPSPSATPEAEIEGVEKSPVELIQEAILDLTEAFDADADHENKAVYAQVLTQLQKVLARQQKSQAQPQV